jgi:tetratricopeptide (TPR) repeat protein
MKSPSDSSRLETLVRERIDRWRAGDRPDSAGVLTDHPELLAAKSLVLDLGLAEYSLRTAAGDSVGRGEFCDRFPAYQQSLAKLLEVHEYLDRFPQFAVDEFAEDGAEVRWPTVGDEFFGYEIVEPLGRGGWARVFLARETAVGRRFVVIKVSRLGSCEAEALGRVSHPSIVPIHSVIHDDGWTVICMPLLGVATAIDLLDAASSADAKRDGSVIGVVARETRPVETVPLPIPVEQFNWRLPYADAVARLGLQLAEGLAAAHAAGILHRDIKPSNILLAWSGRPMLLDFNLATQQGAAGQTVAGTLAYMAPELVESLLLSRQAAGGSEERCDVYSLGAVLFELLTGRLPHEPAGAEKLPLEAYGQWFECKKRPAAALAGEGPMDSRLSAIVLKCLAFAADDRYASAADLAADLRAYLGATATTSRFIKRNRRAVLAAAVGAIGSVALLAAYIGSRPTQFEVLYQRGLGEYDAGDFRSAVATFSKCLELKSGSPEALFGRAQALRQLEKWAEARIDYTALRDADPKWSYALAGYCNMQINDDVSACADFGLAHKNGLRDIGFLMNFARAHIRRRKHFDAANIYSDVLSFDPNNTSALRNRGMALFAAARNDKQRLPDAQAYADIERYRELAPDAFEPACCAAILYGDLARKGAGGDSQAIACLTEALQKGMPLEVVQAYFTQLKRLLPFVDGQTLLAARRDPEFRIEFWPDHEPPATARWAAFQQTTGKQPGMLAQGN